MKKKQKTRDPEYHFEFPAQSPQLSSNTGSLLKKRLDPKHVRTVIPEEESEHKPSATQESEISEKQLEQEHATRQRKNSIRTRRRRWLARTIQIILAVGCAYLVFLTYGMLVTEYIYNEEGEVIPRIVTTQDLHKKVAFEEVFSYYLRARALYEDVLRLDYRLSGGLEEPKLLATEYEAMLEDVSKLSIDLDALAEDSRYSQLKNMLLEWTKSDIAVYLQNISAAISQNNEEKSNNAIVDRERVYQDFLIITENIAVLGEAIPGIDISSVYNWSPERFVKETLEGIPYEQK